MDINTLRLLNDVARLGSFAAAARYRETDPSIVSRQVASAEAELGLRIFQRSTRRLALTEDGAAYLDKIAPALVMLEEAHDAVGVQRDALVGTVRLATSVAFAHDVLIPQLSVFREEYPGIQLELILNDDRTDLLEQGIDIAIRLSPAPEGDLISRKLFSTAYRVCASSDWVQTNRVLRDPRALSDVTCLTYAMPGLRTTWKFQDEDSKYFEVQIKNDLAVSNPLALREAARQGLGPALLADWLVAGDLNKGALVDLFPTHRATITTFDTSAWLLFPSRTYLPRRSRAVIDFLIDQLGGLSDPKKQKLSPTT